MTHRSDRRSFLVATGAAALTLSFEPARALQRRGPSDPLAGMIVINSLGQFADGYSVPPPPPGVNRSPLDTQGIAAARQSGLTAVNITLPAGESFKEAVRTIRRYDALIAANDRQLVKVTSARDVRRAKSQGRVGLIYGFQNAIGIEDDLSNVDAFARLGMRVIQLTYNRRNQLGGGALAPGDPPLTAFGRAVVERLNARRVIVDLSHSGYRTCLDAVAASGRPICISHTGCRALADVPRNKTDEELRAVAERGGYVGIYSMPFLAPGRTYDSEVVVDHIDHAIKICGEDHVGIGTDHGLTPLGPMEAVRANYARIVNQRRSRGVSAPGEDPNLLPYATDLIGPEQFRVLARSLARRGYGGARIEKIMGLNFLRFAEEIWGA